MSISFTGFSFTTFTGFVEDSEFNEQPSVTPFPGDQSYSEFSDTRHAFVEHTYV